MKALPSRPNPALRGWRFAEGVPTPSLYYRGWRRLFQVTFSAFWQTRVFNRHYEPERGSVLYVCNHQSFLDPILMSFALRRPMNYMARESLFRAPLFRTLIRSLNAFPVRRASADTGALKEGLRRLRRGEQLVVFPEGTRTRDGSIQAFLPGVAALIRRAADWVVPVLIDGAFECWPRTQPLPRPGQIVVCYARPFPRAELAGLPPDELAERLRGVLADLQADIRRRRGLAPPGKAGPEESHGRAAIGLDSFPEGE